MIRCEGHSPAGKRPDPDTGRTLAEVTNGSAATGLRTCTLEVTRGGVMSATEVARPVVIVGVDGSPSAEAALRWAEAYAVATGADLELVTAWHYPTSYGIAMPMNGWDPQDDATAVMDKAAALLSLPDDRVRTQVVHGSAAEVLTKASADADLLVVGSRGHGGFTGLLLGSVGAHCMHHARCPVVVVR
jgi:nucleotide-binding universal stress UspA family protein